MGFPWDDDARVTVQYVGDAPYSDAFHSDVQPGDEVKYPRRVAEAKLSDPDGLFAEPGADPKDRADDDADDDAD